MARTVDLSLILPCYNETPVFEGSVNEILTTLRRSGYSFEIIFVDDNSADGTPALIKKTVKKHSECRAIFHDQNRGRGVSVSDGIRESMGTVVGYIDIDCEVSPVYIPGIVDLIMKKDADVVVGKRIYRTTIQSIFREVMSTGYKVLADWMVGTKRIDTESGYKFFLRKKILPILMRTRHPHWFWDTEIIVWSLRGGLTVREMPVLFLRRFDKTSSVNIFRDIADYIVSLRRFRTALAQSNGKG